MFAGVVGGVRINTIVDGCIIRYVLYDSSISFPPLLEHFKLNGGKLFPGQSRRSFFESGREILHVFCEPLRRRDITGLFVSVFFA